MKIVIGSFEYDGGWEGLFVRVPYVGEAWFGGGMTTFDSWRTVRARRAAADKRREALETSLVE